jgi:hypothetical protein
MPPNGTTWAQARQASTELLAKYRMEWDMHQRILRDLPTTAERRRHLLYLTAWLEQPHLGSVADSWYRCLPVA